MDYQPLYTRNLIVHESHAEFFYDLRVNVPLGEDPDAVRNVGDDASAERDNVCVYPEALHRDEMIGKSSGGHREIPAPGRETAYRVEVSGRDAPAVGRYRSVKVGTEQITRKLTSQGALSKRGS